jgi:broad specificity phosphatase PhoE
MRPAASLAAALLAAFTAFAAAEPAPAPEEGTTTVVLVRHAEKVSKNVYSGLTSVGRRRAEALAAELSALRPAALYASDLKRTQQTLQPLAVATGLPVRVRPYGDERALGAEILADHRGEIVVVCGHSGTLSGVAKALGYAGELPDVYGFGGIWTVTIPPSGVSVSLVETRQRFMP